jgi:hypothetical protein
MAKTIEKAGEGITKLLYQIMQQDHGQLADEKVRVAVLMLTPELNADKKPLPPAIKYAGYPVAACIGVPPAWARVLAECDAVLEIDAHRWEELTDLHHRALIDHELQHLDIAVDKHGNTRRHFDGRPVLRTRPDDWVLSGFRAVVERHGPAALEVRAIGELYESCQELFEFMQVPSEPASNSTGRPGRAGKSSSSSAIVMCRSKKREPQAAKLSILNGVA